MEGRKARKEILFPICYLSAARRQTGQRQNRHQKAVTSNVKNTNLSVEHWKKRKAKIYADQAEEISGQICGNLFEKRQCDFQESTNGI